MLLYKYCQKVTTSSIPSKTLLYYFININNYFFEKININNSKKVK